MVPKHLAYIFVMAYFLAYSFATSMVDSVAVRWWSSQQDIQCGNLAHGY